jgi:ribosomal-protein-alanine N-acetyltransferase
MQVNGTLGIFLISLMRFPQNFPFLETERMLLRPLKESDGELFFSLRSNPEVNRFINRNPAKTMEDAEMHITKVLAGVKREETVMWIMEAKENGNAMGSLLFWNLDRETSKAELGYEILPSYSGKGFVSEGLKAILDYGWNQMNLRFVEGIVHRKNLASIHLLEKFGFILSMCEGLEEDELCYLLNRVEN